VDNSVEAGAPALIPCMTCQGTGVTHLTPREALQKLGTEWGRECYPNTWVDLAIRTAEGLLHFADARYDQKRGFHVVAGAERDRDIIVDERVRGVAIPDVRFRNEMAAIRAAGGKVIRVFRPGAGLEGAGGLHISEREQAGIPDTDFDLVIQNDRTLDDLKSAIRGFV